MMKRELREVDSWISSYRSNECNRQEVGRRPDCEVFKKKMQTCLYRSCFVDDYFSQTNFGKQMLNA